MKVRVIGTKEALTKIDAENLFANLLEQFGATEYASYYQVEVVHCSATDDVIEEAQKPSWITFVPYEDVQGSIDKLHPRLKVGIVYPKYAPNGKYYFPFPFRDDNLPYRVNLRHWGGIMKEKEYGQQTMITNPDRFEKLFK